MPRLWTIIAASDVAHSVRWYQMLLGLPDVPPAHSYFGQVVGPDGLVLLSLHAWGEHEHPSMIEPARGRPGNGLILFFRVDAYSDALERARGLAPRLAEESHLNPATGTEEFALYDPDGYFVMVSANASA